MAKAELDFDSYLEKLREKELQEAKEKQGNKQQQSQQKPKQEAGAAYHFDFATGANAELLGGLSDDEEKQEEEEPPSR